MSTTSLSICYGLLFQLFRMLPCRVLLCWIRLCNKFAWTVRSAFTSTNSWFRISSDAATVFRAEVFRASSSGKEAQISTVMSIGNAPLENFGWEAQKREIKNKTPREVVLDVPPRTSSVPPGMMFLLLVFPPTVLS